MVQSRIAFAMCISSLRAANRGTWIRIAAIFSTLSARSDQQRRTIMRLFLLLLLVAPVLDAAVPVPERSLTDPRSLESRTAAHMQAVPIADLFYTRSYAK